MDHGNFKRATIHKIFSTTLDHLILHINKSSNIHNHSLNSQLQGGSSMELELKQITKRFSDTIAVDNFSVKLNYGVIGLLGENGAGKTTLIRIISSLMKPTNGQVLLNGKDIFDMDDQYRNILGYLPQNFGYYPDLNAINYLKYVSSLKGIKSSLANKRIKTLLQTVSLWDVRNKKIKKYSGGMIRRLGIAQALLNDPKILILDEPTAGLDPEERYHFRQLLCSLSKDKIILLSTHIVSDVEPIADKIILMQKGRLLKSGTVKELIETTPVHAWKIKPNSFDKNNMYNKNIIITNSIDSKNSDSIRVLASSAPTIDASLDKCTLEDVFLYYNRKKVETHVIL